MSAREWMGLGLIALAFAMAPFGYWVGVGWFVVALVPLGLGAVMVYSGRVSRKLSDATAFKYGPDAPYLPPGHELKGFRGAAAFNQSRSTADTDDE